MRLIFVQIFDQILYVLLTKTLMYVDIERK